jgi:hypothetical protein
MIGRSSPRVRKRDSANQSAARMAAVMTERFQLGRRSRRSWARDSAFCRWAWRAARLISFFAT